MKVLTVEDEIELLQILCNNLISNSINHNNTNDRIVIDISNDKTQICNTGKTNSLTNNSIFNRFTKENSQYYGLGLSIVKQIYDTLILNIQYTKNEMHCFTITSKK